MVARRAEACRIAKGIAKGGGGDAIAGCQEEEETCPKLFEKNTNGFVCIFVTFQPPPINFKRVNYRTQSCLAKLDAPPQQD